MVKLIISIQSSGNATHTRFDLDTEKASSRDLETLWSDVRNGPFAKEAKELITDYCACHGIDPRVFLQVKQSSQSPGSKAVIDLARRI